MGRGNKKEAVGRTDRISDPDRGFNLHGLFLTGVSPLIATFASLAVLTASRLGVAFLLMPATEHHGSDQEVDRRAAHPSAAT